MSTRIAMILLLAASAPVAPLSAQTAPAANAPQPIARTQFMQRIDSVFVAADANKDGFADRAELEWSRPGNSMLARQPRLSSAKPLSSSSTRIITARSL